MGATKKGSRRPWKGMTFGAIIGFIVHRALVFYLVSAHGEFSLAALVITDFPIVLLYGDFVEDSLLFGSLYWALLGALVVLLFWLPLSLLDS